MKTSFPKNSTSVAFGFVALFFILAIAALPTARAGSEKAWTAVSGNWNQTGTNWQDTVTGTTASFTQGDAVVFGASNSGAATITITGTGGVSIAASGTNPGMIVAGSGDWNFVLSTGTAASGGIGISGSGGVLMQGTGVLTFSTTTAYTGATTVTAGTLKFGVANAIAQSSGVVLAAPATMNLGGFNQSLKALNVGSGAQVVFSGTGGYNTLTLGTLTGNGGVFAMRTNFGANASDKIVITGTSAGAHTLALSNTGGEPKAGAGLLLVQMSGTGAIFSGTTEIGANTYSVQQGANNSWYLFNGSLMSRAAAAVVSAAAVAGQDWHYELDSLYKRMGELREPPLAGHGNLWLRANGSQLNAKDSLTGYAFRQYTYNATLGVDKALRSGGNTVFLGGFGGIGRVDRDFKNGGGDGETDTTGGGLYATWVHEAGWFADVIGRADKNKNTINATTIDGYAMNGKYDSKTKGFSAEFGRRLLLNEDWWIEPGLQYAQANTDGVSYAVVPVTGGQNPLSVNVDKSRASQSRFTFRFGETNGDNPGWHPYAKLAAAYVKTSGGRVSVNASDFAADFDGWRWEVGFGAAYAINSRSQFYYDYEYAWSEKYSRPWAVNAGYRLAW